MGLLLLAFGFQIWLLLWIVRGNRRAAEEEARLRAEEEEKAEALEMAREKARVREEGRLAARKEAKQTDRTARDAAFERRVQTEVERRLGRETANSDDEES